jgi:Bacterial antitoxin of type II TA system, VapB
MNITINIEDELLARARKCMGEEDVETLIRRALTRFCEARDKNQDLWDIAGTVEFYEGYDHKKLRMSRHDAD